MVDPAPLAAALRRALGDDAVTWCAGAPDPEPRTARSITGRDLGAPLAWVRPRDTEACAAVVRIAREAGVPVAVVGEATTFWDGLRVGGAIVIDATALVGPLAIDVERRLAWVGAGRSVRDVDRAARAHGLALAAYPDSSGETPVGSMFAVGCAAGLGMGRSLPVDRITGATLVTGGGDVLRLGASHALGAAAYTRHGLPDALGLFASGEGAAGVVTELGLALVPAGYTVVGRARGAAPRLALDPALRALAAARWGLDRGVVDTFRFEAGADAREDAVAWEVMFRVYSLRARDDAALEARRMAAQLERLGLPKAALDIESEACRRGEGPAYDARHSMPPGEHRRRLADVALWGAEVNVGWGPELHACAERLAALFDEVAGVDPIHRRLGVYPGHHVLSVGVQVTGRRDPAAVEALRDRLRGALPELVARGGVPYRAGNLWRPLLDDHPSARVLDALRRALDPTRVLPGPRGQEAP